MKRTDKLCVARANRQARRQAQRGSIHTLPTVAPSSESIAAHMRRVQDLTEETQALEKHPDILRPGRRADALRARLRTAAQELERAECDLQEALDVECYESPTVTP